jgi:hypothetical protein
MLPAATATSTTITTQQTRAVWCRPNREVATPAISAGMLKAR